ncbi:hypothetical protein N574_00015 [Lactiplantibacillus plantarum 2165]|nr:hypothetical protein N574_00015 [Lactiplantibacillus plantarum 2165]
MIVEYIKVKKPEVSTKMKLPQLNRVLNVFSLFFNYGGGFFVIMDYYTLVGNKKF